MILPKEKTAELGRSLKKVYRNEISIDDSVDIAKNEIINMIQNAKDITLPLPPRIFEVEKSSSLCKCPKCGNIIACTDKGFRCNNSMVPDDSSSSYKDCGWPDNNPDKEICGRYAMAFVSKLRWCM